MKYTCIKNLDAGLGLGVKVGDVVDFKTRGKEYVADDFVIGQIILDEYFKEGITMKSNDELEALTEKWGADRKITINGNTKTQVIKFAEEMGELFEADSKDQVVDAIGDMVVVLSMIANLNGTSISTCKKLNSTQSFITRYQGHNRLLLLPVVYGQLCSAVSRDQNEKLPDIIADTMDVLEEIAVIGKTNLNECWNHAYEEIKDRKGTLLENGVFVKDE